MQSLNKDLVACKTRSNSVDDRVWKGALPFRLPGQLGAQARSHLKEVTPTMRWQPGRAMHGSQHRAQRLNPTDTEVTGGTNFVIVKSTNFIPQLPIGNVP